MVGHIVLLECQQSNWKGSNCQHVKSFFQRQTGKDAEKSFGECIENDFNGYSCYVLVGIAGGTNIVPKYP